MNRDEGLAAAFFAIVIGGAVALTIANDITAPACTAAHNAIKGAKDFDFGCLEFWLNRYQALISAFVGIGVAYYVLRPAIAQMKAANRQAAAAAKVVVDDAIRTAADEVSAILTMISQAASATFSAADIIDPEIPPPKNWDENLRKLVESLRAAGKVIEAAREAHPDSEAENALRETAYRGARLLGALLHDLAYRQAHSYEVTYNNDGYPISYSQPEVEEAAQSVFSAAERLRVSAGKLLASRQTELANLRSAAVRLGAQARHVD